MDGFTYIVLSVAMVCMVSGVRFREADTCMLYWCSIVELVVDMLRVPSLWLLLGCVHIVLIRILYSLFLDERGIYHYLLQLTKCKCFVFVQTWNSQLSSSTGNLRFYKLFKTAFEREPYLNLPPHLRVPITKLRISCHPLQIETGSYTIPSPIPSSERFCCERKVEDELHFVFQCQLYENLPEWANLLQFCHDKLNSCYDFLENIIQTHLISWESTSTIPTRCLSTSSRLSKPGNNI